MLGLACEPGPPILSSMNATLRSVRVAALGRIDGLIHGFERREQLPAASPRVETREESRRRVASALRDRGTLLTLRQVHGAHVERAPWSGRPEADAAVVQAPGYLIGIETADCLPVLIVDPRQRIAAAAHAGWRGTAARIAVRTVEAMTQLGAAPAQLLAALGPGISRCCYEVGPDLEHALGPSGAPFLVPGTRERRHLDLRAYNVHQLEAAGLRRECIHDFAECTACRAQDYHSYRRDGAGSGRMMSYIGWQA